MELKLLPLVPEVPLPWRAPASTRTEVPRGYGVQEQCLPFTAACALGLLVPAPFDFGLCTASAVPPGARAFSAPEVARPAGDERVFYVIDHADPLPFVDEAGHALEMRPRQPGISFMDRPDQTSFFKLHVRRGDVIAQVFFIDRAARRSEAQVLDAAAPEAAVMREELRQWFLAHHADRSAYRRLARSRQGRLEMPEA